ncbi:MAG: hypothetical protein OEX04_19905, partial [Acidimicrobiia bacterium]|nr:hypothetical protein [Acidimicrobiia bacterium]
LCSSGCLGCGTQQDRVLDVELSPAGTSVFASDVGPIEVDRLGADFVESGVALGVAPRCQDSRITAPAR